MCEEEIDFFCLALSFACEERLNERSMWMVCQASGGNTFRRNPTWLNGAFAWRWNCVSLYWLNATNWHWMSVHAIQFAGIAKAKIQVSQYLESARYDSTNIKMNWCRMKHDRNSNFHDILCELNSTWAEFISQIVAEVSFTHNGTDLLPNSTLLSIAWPIHFPKQKLQPKTEEIRTSSKPKPTMPMFSTIPLK